MHPCDDANARIVSGCILHRTTNCVGVLEHGLPDNFDWSRNTCGKLSDHGLRLLINLSKGVFAVEILASREEPDLLRARAECHRTAPLPSQNRVTGCERSQYPRKQRNGTGRLHRFGFRTISGAGASVRELVGVIPELDDGPDFFEAHGSVHPVALGVIGVGVKDHACAVEPT